MSGHTLGAGADGRVGRVIDRRTGIWHALKKVHASAYSVGRELEILRMLQHPNIVRLEAAFPPAGERKGWALAFREADFTLEAYIARSRGTGRLTPAVAEDLSKQLLAGILCVHRSGWIHRDLKPSNLLLELADPAEKIRNKTKTQQKPKKSLRTPPAQSAVSV